METKLVTYPYYQATINIIGEISEIKQENRVYSQTIITVKFGLNEKLDVYSPRRLDLNVGDTVSILGEMTMTNNYHRANEKYEICEKVPLIAARYIKVIGAASELYPTLTEEEKEIAAMIERLSKMELDQANTN